MKEVVIISERDEKGHPSLTAALAALAGHVVRADCRVDAPGQDAVVAGTITRRELFRCGHEAFIRQESCTGCGVCLTQCRAGAVRQVSKGLAEGLYGARPARCDICEICVRSCPVRFAAELQAMQETIPHAPAFVIDPAVCDGCGACVGPCPVKAIDFPERIAGECFVSTTACGPMAHGRLAPGARDSGELIRRVREEARRLADQDGYGLLLTDGPPGGNGSLAATITGASRVLIVIGPTPSGLQDLERVMALTWPLRIPTMVCVNEWDLDPAQTESIEHQAMGQGACVAGRIRHNSASSNDPSQGDSVMGLAPNPVAADIRGLWTVLTGGKRW